jgi:glycosyltransferase involved in cell wall biosynthesis
MIPVQITMSMDNIKNYIGNFGSITVGIPCHNEAGTVGKVVADFKRILPEARILVIDNASTDDTFRLAKQSGADVVKEYRLGKGHAVQRLFSECISDYLIMVDGDDTYCADDALELLKTVREKGGDAVVGTRISKHKEAFKPLHTVGNRLMAFLIELVFAVPVADLFSGYRLFSRCFYRNVPVLSSGFEVESELTLHALDKGFLQHHVEIDYRPRPDGSLSKLNTVKDGARVVMVVVALIKNFKPVFFFGCIGAMLVVMSLLSGMFPVMDYIRYRYVFHVPLAILATGLMLLFALSLGCGIVLDTIARHNREQFCARMRDFYESHRGGGITDEV